MQMLFVLCLANERLLLVSVERLGGVEEDRLEEGVVVALLRLHLVLVAHSLRVVVAVCRETGGVWRARWRRGGR